MSSLDPIPFKEVEPKPPMFPFFRKPQVKKKWVDLSQVTDKKFGKELAKNIKSEEKASYSKEQKKSHIKFNNTSINFTKRNCKLRIRRNFQY